MDPALGGTALVLAGGALYCALLSWARRPGRTHRWPMLVSATATGGVVAGANLLASSLGWWGGHWSYSLPVSLQVCFWVLCLTPPVVLALAGYRWLVSRTHRPRLVYGVILLGVLGPLTAIADAFALNTGRLSFGGGYTIWQDVIVGQALLWFPVLLYELLKPRARPRWSA